MRSVALGTLKHNIRTIVGLHACEGGTGLTLHEDADALSDTPVSGICLFREGAFAMAFSEGKALSVLNPMNKPITAIAIGCDGAPFSPDGPILPGEERRIPLSGSPEVVRAFSGSSEVSVLLTKH